VPIVETKEGLQLRDNLDGTLSLILDSARLDECLAYIKKTQVKQIEINSVLRFSGSSIDFLSEVSEILEGLVLLETKVGYEVINTLKNLKYLVYSDNGKDTIDLNNFPQLEHLATNYSKRLKGLDNCQNLRSLILFGYKSASASMAEFPQLQNLRVLDLRRTNLVTLDGIDQLIRLEEFLVYGALKLVTIKALSDLNYLKSIEIVACKKISDFDTLGNIQGLEKVKISGSGSTPTLSFVRKLRNLKHFSFWDFSVEDGDMSYLKGIDHVAFQDKKHYSMKSREFKKS
jgi:hypothetical protein